MHACVRAQAEKTVGVCLAALADWQLAGVTSFGISCVGVFWHLMQGLSEGAQRWTHELLQVQVMVEAVQEGFPVVAANVQHVRQA